MIHLIKKFINGQNPASPSFKSLDQLAQDNIDLQYLADLSTFGASGIFGKEENLAILEGLIARKTSHLSDENVRDIVKIAMLEPTEQKCRILDAVSAHPVAVNKLAGSDAWKRVVSEEAFESAEAMKTAIIGKKLDGLVLADAQYILTTPAVKTFINGKEELVDKIYNSDVLLARVIGNQIFDIPSLTAKMIANGDAILNRAKAVDNQSVFGYTEQEYDIPFYQATTMATSNLGYLTLVKELKHQYPNNQYYTQTHHIDTYLDQSGDTRFIQKVSINNQSNPIAVNKWVAKQIYYTCTHENAGGGTAGFQVQTALRRKAQLTGKAGWN